MGRRMRERLIENVSKLIRGARALGVPVVHTEQYPKGLGPTEPQLAELLEGDPITKLHFSCFSEPAFRDAIEAIGRRQVVLAGMETHICVYQTAMATLTLEVYYRYLPSFVDTPPQ